MMGVVESMLQLQRGSHGCDLMDGQVTDLNLPLNIESLCCSEHCSTSMHSVHAQCALMLCLFQGLEAATQKLVYCRHKRGFYPMTSLS
jgi:hypothetical protein